MKLFSIFLTILALLLVPSVKLWADSTEASFVETTISSKVEATNPVGTIIAWYSKRSPGSGWLECNGQTFDSTLYPKLYLYLGKTNLLPDFRNQFLRAGSASQLGIKVEDSIASHQVSIAEQAISQGKLQNLTGQATLAPQSLISEEAKLTVTGVAEGQKVDNLLAQTQVDLSNVQAQGQTYQQLEGSSTKKYYWSRDGSNLESGLENYAALSESPLKYYNTDTALVTAERVAGTALLSENLKFKDATSSASNLTGYALAKTTIQGQTEGGSISGQAIGQIKSLLSQSKLKASLEDGSVSGVIGAHQGNYIGGSETAPKHVFVRYFIRAL
ncbi:MAG: tail fiber protein [Desulfovibrionaceae bacterium]|nr:tail fiber protein [Desulfovibrionaceae bacterium]